MSCYLLKGPCCTVSNNLRICRKRYTSVQMCEYRNNSIVYIRKVLLEKKQKKKTKKKKKKTRSKHSSMKSKTEYHLELYLLRVKHLHFLWKYQVGPLCVLWSVDGPMSITWQSYRSWRFYMFPSIMSSSCVSVLWFLFFVIKLLVQVCNNGMLEYKNL